MKPIPYIQYTRQINKDINDLLIRIDKLLKDIPEYLTILQDALDKEKMIAYAKKVNKEQINRVNQFNKEHTMIRHIMNNINKQNLPLTEENILIVHKQMIEKKDPNAYPLDEPPVNHDPQIPQWLKEYTDNK